MDPSENRAEPPLIQPLVAPLVTPLVSPPLPASGRGRELGWFIAVGCSAAAVHWAAVVWLVSHAGWQPVLANGPAWLLAFSVSFMGHHRLTFAEHRAPVRRAARRFLAVSATGFAVNEAVYALLLHSTDAAYDLLLAIVLVGVAVFTYLLGRHWAFARNASRPPAAATPARRARATPRDG